MSEPHGAWRPCPPCVPPTRQWRGGRGNSHSVARQGLSSEVLLGSPACPPPSGPPRRPACRLGRPVGRPESPARTPALGGGADRAGATRQAPARAEAASQEAARRGRSTPAGRRPSRRRRRPPRPRPVRASAGRALTRAGAASAMAARVLLSAALLGRACRAWRSAQAEAGRSGAAQPRSSCRAAASCVRATCPVGPLNKSCARGPARGCAQRPLQPEGPHSRGPRPSRAPAGPHGLGGHPWGGPPRTLAWAAGVDAGGGLPADPVLAQLGGPSPGPNPPPGRWGPSVPLGRIESGRTLRKCGSFPLCGRGRAVLAGKSEVYVDLPF